MLLPPFYRVECLSSIFLGFLSLPVTALKKCVSPNWFSSSLPIYINPLIAKAGKTYSSDSCSCWPVGEKWVSQLWDVWNQDFLLRSGVGAPLCPLYHCVVSQPILESKKIKMKPKWTHTRPPLFLLLTLRNRIITWTSLTKEEASQGHGMFFCILKIGSFGV